MNRYLAFFVAHAAHHVTGGRPAECLWMCHVSNVTLAAGLLLARPELVRIAVLWLLPGLPLWLGDLIQTGESPPTTFLAHFGGAAVGLVALRRTGMGRWSWALALAWYLFWQEICRVATPPELNVNIAHRLRPGWETLFDSYAGYWVGSTLLAAFVLWAEGAVLRRIWPAPEEPSAPSSIQVRRPAARRRPSAHDSSAGESGGSGGAP